MARDLRYKRSAGQAAYRPEATAIWHDETLHRLADALLAEPRLLAADLAMILARFRSPPLAGDTSLEQACQDLPTQSLRDGSAFRKALLAFYGAATADDFSLRLGLLFELILYKLLIARYDRDEPREWCEHNVKVGRATRGRIEWFEHCDLDVAGWAKYSQRGEFYSAKVSGAFQLHELTCLSELGRFLEDNDTLVRVGVWALTRTASQLEAKLDGLSPQRPTDIRFFGWDSLASVARSIPV